MKDPGNLDLDDEGEWCDDCDRRVSSDHWRFFCHCDDPVAGRTMAKGTPAERRYCGKCKKRIREEIAA